MLFISCIRFIFPKADHKELPREIFKRSRKMLQRNVTTCFAGDKQQIAFFEFPFVAIHQNSMLSDATYTAITVAFAVSCRVLATAGFHKGTSTFLVTSRAISRDGSNLRVQSVLWKLARERASLVEMISLSRGQKKSG